MIRIVTPSTIPEVAKVVMKGKPQRADQQPVESSDSDGNRQPEEDDPPYIRIGHHRGADDRVEGHHRSDGQVDAP
jgi:hypothetical protein